MTSLRHCSKNRHGKAPRDFPSSSRFAGLVELNKAAQKKYTLTDGTFLEYILVFWEGFGVKNRVDPLFKSNMARAERDSANCSEIVASNLQVITTWYGKATIQT